MLIVEATPMCARRAMPELVLAALSGPESLRRAAARIATRNLTGGGRAPRRPSSTGSSSAATALRPVRRSPLNPTALYRARNAAAVAR